MHPYADHTLYFWVLYPPPLSPLIPASIGRHATAYTPPASPIDGLH